MDIEDAGGFSMVSAGFLYGISRDLPSGHGDGADSETSAPLEHRGRILVSLCLIFRVACIPPISDN